MTLIIGEVLRGVFWGLRLVIRLLLGLLLIILEMIWLLFSQDVVSHQHHAHMRKQRWWQWSKTQIATTGKTTKVCYVTIVTLARLGCWRASEGNGISSLSSSSSSSSCLSASTPLPAAPFETPVGQNPTTRMAKTIWPKFDLDGTSTGGDGGVIKESSSGNVV